MINTVIYKYVTDVILALYSQLQLLGHGFL